MKSFFQKVTLISILLGQGFMAGVAQAQSVVNVSPSPNANDVSPNTAITGNLRSSNNISIPANSVRIFLDGQDVTNQSGINNAFFSYQPSRDLSPGTHTATIEFVGSDGIARFVTWDFVVAANTSNRLQITQINHNSARGLINGDTFQATLRGTPQQQAEVLLVQADRTGRAVQAFPATEVSSGIYRVTFPVGQNVLEEGMVIGRLTNSQDRVAYGIARGSARFNSRIQSSSNNPLTQIKSGNSTIAATELRPRFTSHQNGDRIQSRNGFRLIGQTQPGASVRVKVTQSSRSIGNILGSILSGNNVLLERTVSANSQGQFEVIVPSPLVNNQGLRYQIEAIAENQGRRSQTSNLELIQN